MAQTQNNRISGASRDPDLMVAVTSFGSWVVCEVCCVLLRVRGINVRGSTHRYRYEPVTRNWPNYCERCEETAWTAEEWDTYVLQGGNGTSLVERRTQQYIVGKWTEPVRRQEVSRE